MTAIELLNILKDYLGEGFTSICEMHSACSPHKGKSFICEKQNSSYPVLDFDAVKRMRDDSLSQDHRKSADAVCVSGSQQKFCMVEMKSWEMFLKYQCSSKSLEEAKTAIQDQADKYEKDVPGKLQSSVEICNEIANDANLFGNVELHYILLSDTDSKTNGIEFIAMNLSMLGTSTSDLRSHCNTLSQAVMSKIKDASPHYWNCRDFDSEIRAI